MRTTFTDQAIFDGLQTKDAPITDAIVGFLYEQSQKSITRMVIRHNGDEADADDLFQEVIVAFLHNVWTGKYQPGSAKVTTYLYSIAQTMWLKELGRRSARATRTDRYGRDQYALPDTPDPEQELMNDEEVQSARAIFNRLSDTCQQILTAFYFDKMTMKQIADQFDLGTEDNAKTKKYRCVLALRRLMTPYEQTNQ